MNFTPENIMALKPNERFVFGSNLAGRHGAGAARTARLRFGAEPGIGMGPTGRCYAIPTKNLMIETLPPHFIASYVNDFIAHARAHPELHFLVTAVGCGLAGYTPEEIAPMFHGVPENVSLPASFWQVLEGKS